jgi:hypothetical protein
MINKGQINAEELKIQGLLDRYLSFRSANNNFNGNNHLDEDSLTAFVESNLSERESPSIIKHLVDCSFCLHVTSELAKMNAVFAEEEAGVSIPAAQPTKVSEVLSGLLSRIFGTTDGAVFAHEEKEEDGTEAEKKDDK